MRRECHLVALPFLLAVLVAGCCSLSATSSTSCHKLLLVLLDGFRWDYAQKMHLTTFSRLQTRGARAGYLKNDFPTLSYPNYYSLTTGVHTESHGMTGNYMYDAARREYFLNGKNPESRDSYWWDGAEPVWITATKQHKNAHMFYWPGCDVAIGNMTPAFCDPYKNFTTQDDFRRALKGAISQLVQIDGADLAGVYHQLSDHVGHQYGPESEQLAEAARNIDADLGVILDYLENLKGIQKINLIIVSDHGMTSIDPRRTINITGILIDRGLYVAVTEAGAIASIYTADTDKAQQVYDLLKDFSPNMRVYKKEDIPDLLYYKHGKYVADVTCIADLGWVIAQPFYSTFPHLEGQYMRGLHGYDNKEVDMRGIFYAYGPYFKSGAEVNFIAAVDVYNIMCDILGIKAAPNNGTRERLHPLLATSVRHCAFLSQRCFHGTWTCVEIKEN